MRYGGRSWAPVTLGVTVNFFEVLFPNIPDNGVLVDRRVECEGVMAGLPVDKVADIRRPQQWEFELVVIGKLFDSFECADSWLQLVHGDISLDEVSFWPVTLELLEDGHECADDPSPLVGHLREA